MNKYKITPDRVIAIIGGILPLVIRFMISLTTNWQIEPFDIIEVIFFGVTVCLTDSLFFINQIENSNSPSQPLNQKTPTYFIYICFGFIILLLSLLTLAHLSKRENVSYNNTWILILSLIFSIGSLTLRRFYNYYKNKKS